MRAKRVDAGKKMLQDCVRFDKNLPIVVPNHLNTLPLEPRIATGVTLPSACLVMLTPVDFNHEANGWRPKICNEWSQWTLAVELYVT